MTPSTSKFPRHCSSTIVIYALLVCLVLFGFLSWFWLPVYEKGAWAVETALVAAFSGALGFKFGITQVKSKEN